jgi:hemerythrin-like metal-binding protein
MALIEWSEALSVGIPSIDEQHRELVDIINDLHGAMLRREAREALAEIFERLAEYTERHFAHEEMLFDQFGYEGASAHKTQHSMLIAKVNELRGQFESGRVTVTMEVMEFLRDWLRNHIAVSDRRYAPFLKERGVV